MIARDSDTVGAPLEWDVGRAKAMAMRKVLEEESFKNICLVVLSLPLALKKDCSAVCQHGFMLEKAV